MHSFASDPVVTQYTDWGPNSIDDTRAFLVEAAGQATDPQRANFSLAVVLATSGELIGSAAIAVTSVQHKRGEFGFVFHRDFWSQGYETEAGKLLVHFGFQSLQLQHISATCHPNNYASARVLQKGRPPIRGPYPQPSLRPRELARFAALRLINGDEHIGEVG